MTMRCASIVTEPSSTSRPLWRSTRGVVLVEFAMIALPFFAVLLAALMTSLVFFAQQTLESVTARSGRLLLTGSDKAAVASKAAFKTRICNDLPAYLRCENLLLTAAKPDTFTAADFTQPTIRFDARGKPIDDLPFIIGEPGKITVLRVLYVWDLPTVSLGYDISNLPGGRRLLVGTAIARAELYK